MEIAYSDQAHLVADLDIDRDEVTETWIGTTHESIPRVFRLPGVSLNKIL